MNESFNLGKRRKDYSSYFSPVKTNKSIQNTERYYNDDSTPKSSRTAAAATVDLASLLEAITSKDVDSFTEMLLACKNIDVNQIVPGSPMTLMHYSVGCSENDIRIVETLLRLGGDPNNVNIEEKLSPLHLSAWYDYDRVMSILIEYGGDPKIPNGDGETCFDIVRRNLEEESLDSCLKVLFQKSNTFRKSIGPPKSNAYKRQELYDSGSDGFYSCDSQQFGEANLNFYSQNERIHSIVRKFCPEEYSNFMTEDESAETSSSDDDTRKKLTTIKEESSGSGVVSSSSPGITAAFSAVPFTPTFSPAHRCRGIGSITAPIYVLTDDSISDISDSGPSCVNSTPPITPQPSKEDLEKLQERMKQLNIPVTPLTYGVMSKVSQSESRMQALLTPKTGAANYSLELQAGIENMHLIYEWGNLKVDMLQNAAPSARTGKSFYNYLLLDPRILKRANFSGDHLKTNVINNPEKFSKFLESIFYIGKAHGKRPLQHLVEAKQRYAETKKEIGKRALQYGEKIDKILEIWKSGLGVIIVNMFHYSSEREANVNEACMIDAMGLVELSNIKKGSYQGTATANWSQKTKNQLGSFLLLNSFRSFVVNDPKQFFPQDF